MIDMNDPQHQKRKKKKKKKEEDKGINRGKEEGITY